jgi:CBS domain-containing protein
MKAADVMTRRVISIAADASILQAVRLMLQNRISGLPVVDARDNLVGIVTEGDFLRRAETGTQRRRLRWVEFLIGTGWLAGDYVHAHGRKVEEVMTRDPHTITVDTPIGDIVHLMEKRRIKRVPVVRGRKVVGIVSRANLMRALVSLALDAKAPALDDAAIRERLLAELDKEPWSPRASIDVVVRNGVVDLFGTIMDERVRDAVVVAAENTPGVKAVRDHLCWLDAHGGMIFPVPEPPAPAETRPV